MSPENGWRILAKFFVFLTFFFLSLSAGAVDATRITDSDWTKILTLMTRGQDPLARKMTFWIEVTQTDRDMPLTDLMDFVRSNPDWPGIGVFRDRIEREMEDATPRSLSVAEWFRKNPPRSVSGVELYARALIDIGAYEEVKKFINDYWREAELSKSETQQLSAGYKKYFSLTAHADRMDSLLWGKRYEEASAMLSLVDPDLRKLAKARISLGRQSSKASADLQDVPQKHMRDEGLLFDRLRWKRRNSDAYDGSDILGFYKGMSSSRYPEEWWKEIHILARRAMEKRAYGRAYDILRHHRLQSGTDYIQAEWLLGWVELRHLRKSQDAYKRFDRLYPLAQSAITKSRIAYWTARAATSAHQDSLAQNWYTVCAAYLSTFYGQICYQEAYGAPDVQKMPQDVIWEDRRAEFDKKDLVQSVRLLQRFDLMSLTDVFFTRLLAGAKDKIDYALVAKLAHETNNIQFAVQANKDAQQKLGVFLWEDGYPVPAVLGRDPEKALVSAIIYRESMFDKDVVSPAGAMGLMQLMPATAKETAQRGGFGYSRQKLTQDPAYNIRLGSAYLSKLVGGYDGFYPYAIAAYNGGPSNVNSWIDDYGDPAEGKADLVDWVESIPVYETRNYVQRVLETYYMYRIRYGQEPKTIFNFVQ